MKWIAARVTQQDRRLAKEMHESVDRGVAGIKKRFGRWARVNHFAPTPTYTTFVLCAASMRNHQLKPNSVKTYLTNVLRAFRWQMPRDTYSRCKHALGKWEYTGRHESTKRATEITIEEARALGRKIPDLRARLVVELMCYTPLRLADLCDIHWGEISTTADLVVFQLVGGKNRRTRIAQERFRVERVDLPSWLLRQLTAGMATRPGDKPITHFSTVAMNRILQQASGKPLTTYSLRNAYHHEVIRQCTRDGRVDWKEVAERTLHRSEKTVKAHYDRH